MHHHSLYCVNAPSQLAQLVCVYVSLIMKQYLSIIAAVITDMYNDSCHSLYVLLQLSLWLANVAAVTIDIPSAPLSLHGYIITAVTIVISPCNCNHAYMYHYSCHYSYSLNAAVRNGYISANDTVAIPHHMWNYVYMYHYSCHYS